MILNFILLVTIKLTFCDIISKSSIELCEKRSNNTTVSNLNCTQKLVLALSIENGKLADTDSMEVFVSSVTDLKGDVQQLQNPFKITIQKSPVYLEYPCIYQQDFNFRPFEQIFQSDVFSCSDGDLAPNPTCGWQYSNNKITIPYSQGFCCKCEFDQIIGIDTTTRNRGSTCGLLNIGTGSASAHCLRFDKLWYSTYEIKPYQVNYVIDIIVTYKSNITNYTNEVVSLSPSNLVSTSREGNMIARLIGDFSPPTQPNDYTSYYLTIPSYPETHQMVLEGPINWMILPKSYFTLDGRECNKIGISYYAFRTQSNACTVKIGECLNNQIYNYYQNDIDLLASNKSPKYLLFSKTDEYNFYSYSKGEKKFSKKLNGVFNTLITLELIADDIKFIINISTGLIDFAMIDTFESLSNDGLLTTQITNSGDLTAAFSLNFNCSDYILPIQGTQASLKPFESLEFKKPIFTLNSDFKSHYCNITLKDAIGGVLDRRSVNFNTTKVIPINNQNTNSTDGETNSTSSQEYIELSCQQLCPGFFEFLCFVAHGCWGYLARTLGILLLCLVVIIFIIKWIKSGGLCRLIDRCVKCASFNSSSDVHINNNVVNSKSVYFNFNIDKFDFSLVNINYSFSVLAQVNYLDIKGYTDIVGVVFRGNFKSYVDIYYKEALCPEQIKSLINMYPELMTTSPLYTLIN
jgi:hypothetical protein